MPLRCTQAGKAPDPFRHCRKTSRCVPAVADSETTQTDPTESRDVRRMHFRPVACAESFVRTLDRDNQRNSKMSLLLIIIVLVLLFGGGGYYGYNRYGGAGLGGVLGLVVLVLVVLWLAGMLGI